MRSKGMALQEAATADVQTKAVPVSRQVLQPDVGLSLRDPRAGASSLLGLQRSAGNQAVCALLGRHAGASSTAMANGGGLIPDLAPQVDAEPLEVGGSTSTGGVTLQAAPDAGTGTPDAGAPAAPTITTSTVTGPTWASHGSFTWDVGFTTTGKSGWIVQELVNTYSGTDAAGAAIVSGVVPHYWEAWAVDSASAVSPSAGSVNDMWRRPSRGNGTKGSWSMASSCFFTKTDPAANGLTPGGVSNAGILLSGTTAPPGLGTNLLSRAANGTWDSSTATPTHTGTAGP